MFIGGHSSRFVLFCSFWRLFTIKMINSVKVFPFSLWKILIYTFFLLYKRSNPRHKHAKWPPSDLTPWTLTLIGFQHHQNGRENNHVEPQKLNWGHRPLPLCSRIPPPPAAAVSRQLKPVASSQPEAAGGVAAHGDRVAGLFCGCFLLVPLVHPVCSLLYSRPESHWPLVLFS